jgi:hypothetical protein
MLTEKKALLRSQSAFGLLEGLVNGYDSDWINQHNIREE